MSRLNLQQQSDGQKKNERSTKVGRIGAILLIVLLLLLGGFVAWAETPPSPMSEAIAALESDSVVTVKRERWIEFIPVKQPATTGFIFYPGGRVDSSSYAPLLRKLAEAGYYAVIVPMRLNLAFFSPNRANDVIAARPEIEHWVIGGHSLGGTMAASYAFNHPEAIQGLALWASYPQASESLVTNDQLQTLSIYGTNDGLVSEADIQESIANLPKETIFVPINGGNHGQFGWYGEQSGDSAATITYHEQLTQTVAATLVLLQNIDQLK